MKKAYEFICMSYEGVSGNSQFFEEYLQPGELEKIKDAIEKRRLEFLYGRVCAKLAYAKLCGSGIFDSRIGIFNDCCGTPYFEDGNFFVGITHDRGLAAAIVTDRQKLRAGVDVQKILPEHTKAIYRVMEQREKVLFDGQCRKYGRDFLACAVWVAKESMSKLLGYGFSVLDALEVSGFEQDSGFTVKFANFKGFTVLVRPYNGYLFGFAAKNKDIANFKEDRLVICKTPGSVLKEHKF